MVPSATLPHRDADADAQAYRYLRSHADRHPNGHPFADADAHRHAAGRASRTTVASRYRRRCSSRRPGSVGGRAWRALDVWRFAATVAEKAFVRLNRYKASLA